MYVVSTWATSASASVWMCVKVPLLFSLNTFRQTETNGACLNSIKPRLWAPVQVIIDWLPQRYQFSICTHSRCTGRLETVGRYYICLLHSFIFAKGLCGCSVFIIIHSGLRVNTWKMYVVSTGLSFICRELSQTAYILDTSCFQKSYVSAKLAVIHCHHLAWRPLLHTEVISVLFLSASCFNWLTIGPFKRGLSYL